MTLKRVIEARAFLADQLTDRTADTAAMGQWTGI